MVELLWSSSYGDLVLVEAEGTLESSAGFKNPSLLRL